MLLGVTALVAAWTQAASAALLPLPLPLPLPIVVRSNVDALMLLLPDTMDLSDPRIAIWRDAAAEEGLRLTPVRDATFLSAQFDTSPFVGLILPDQVHARASDELLAKIRKYVAGGGQLMLVFDAGTLTSTGFYPVPKSRLCDLAGVDYAMYDELRDRTIGLGAIVGTERTMCALHVPPGKFMPADGVFTDMPTTMPPPGDAPEGKRCTVSGFQSTLYSATGYVYGFLTYPGFVTRGTPPGLVLLSSPAFGLAAAYNRVGKGGVLFVNLPLGYLKQQTDGVWLHGFLALFAGDLLHLPMQSPVPRGVGGLVLNWHLDSMEAQAPLLQLRQDGVFNQGPYSIHVTAGPDTIDPGDGLGFDLPHNAVLQGVLRNFAQQGHQVGSHGGWIHDYWGAHVDETNQALYEPLLVLNKAAVEAATGRPVTEYSAPVGNQPEWATTWLEQHGVLGYYIAGNTGLGPTRTYRNGRLLNTSIWSVPVSNYGKYATFEEFDLYGVGHPEATSWLVAMANFGQMYRTSRLVYCHPPGALDYQDSLQGLLLRAATFQRDGAFRWYTMTQLAQFMSKREKITWNVSEVLDGSRLIKATHPSSLKDAAWVFPKAYYSMPLVVKGSATVTSGNGHWKPPLNLVGNLLSVVGSLLGQDDGEWLVIAGDGTELQFEIKPLAS
jgi:hypothetical protein